MYFPKETLPLEVYQEAYYSGELKNKKGRDVYILHGMFFPAARVIWNVNHPDDLAQPNEEVHHKDLNRNNNELSNLEKRTKREHKRIHNQVYNETTDPLPDGMKERIFALFYLLYPLYRSYKRIAKQASEEFNYPIGKRRVYSVCKPIRRKHSKAQRRERKAA